ncbi:hypothetical protein [Fluviispira multicolorata]|uniref:Uncharacterized protein n=1 Tax=Fluviispira multicolorata TaxID=2654512 RepID=A0A833N4I2_9BACT|nr:hypothetical protein [Fluviispira multicolorata]KAB8030846.1 hypothetical protein GCL57_07680 [Fluviispira multicolorata]
MIYFHTRPQINLSLFEESSSESPSVPVKRGRGRPPKLKAVTSDLVEKKSNIEDVMSTSMQKKIDIQDDQIEDAENIVSLNSDLDSNNLEEISSNQWDLEQINSFDGEDDMQAFDDNLEQQFEEDFSEEDAAQQMSEARDFSQNHVSLSFSWSLMNQLRQMSKMEGIAVEDLLVELVAEGVAKRVFEDQNRPMPSHLMTRTGYVHSDGNQVAPQPHLSHHAMNNNNRQQPNNLQNRNRFNFQQRNMQHQQQNRNPNNNRNYQQNNNNRQQQNGQNGFRNQYNNNSQSRFNARPNNNNNSQRFYEDSSNTQQGNTYNRTQRDHNKR